MGIAISQASRDKIVGFEIGSRAYYDKVACHPVWPGGSSGITIGIGYDLGQHAAAQFNVDWTLDPTAMKRLAAVCTHTGANAQWILHTVADLVIPYDDAEDVFDRVVLPRYVAMTTKAFPNCDKLPPDAFGVLVSLVYNRGPSTVRVADGRDSRAEMADIKTAMTAQNFQAIPGYLRAMKRLWPVSKGLQARREWEATAFEAAIGTTTKPSPVIILPVRRPPPVVDSTDNVSDVLNQMELDRIRRRNE